ncbi:MAG: redoxin domain-containing protein [Boseongicola sp.]|nr:MAG: redoxin domain-containing protein [Boseongicola sp.]
MSLVGQPAPNFTLPRDGGTEITLSEFRTGPVVLYFYPRDDTGGCTKEAISFTDLKDDFAALGTVIIGVSKDSIKKHDNFIAKHDLDVMLASDADGDTCERFGVWVKKQMYGRKFMGIERTTFLIASDGTVVNEWRKVKVPGHAEAVLDAVKAL